MRLHRSGEDYLEAILMIRSLLNNSISSNEQKLLVTRYTNIIFSLKHLSNLNYNEQDKVLKNIFDENENHFNIYNLNWF